MSRKLHVLFVIALLLFCPVSYAQTTVISFDGSASQWITGQMDAANTFQLTDDFADYEEGIGSMQVHTAIVTQGASWGTWTDAKYTFTQPQNWSGATDLILKIKIVQAPVNSRSLQFTMDVFDRSGSGEELWRWLEDLDIL